VKSLAAFYRSHLDFFNREDLWCCALKHCFSKTLSDEALIWELLDECREMHTDSPTSYLHRLRKLASLSFFHQFQPIPKVKALMQQVYREIDTLGFWDEFHLGKALYSLGCHLIGLPTPKIEPTQLAKGGILLESGDHFRDGGMPHLLLNAELALIWLFLGWKLKCDKLIEGALKWANFSVNFFDHEGRPFHGMWIRESEYSPLLLYAFYFLLFSMSSRIATNPKISQLADNLFDVLEKMDHTVSKTSVVFSGFFSLGFEYLNQDGVYSEVINSHPTHEIDQDLGYLLFKQNDFSFACSFSGVNTGLGALHKTDVRIVSFGPHRTPLGDPDCYGIYRTCSFHQPFRDIELVKTSDNFALKGWTRILSSDMARGGMPGLTINLPSRHWLYFCAEGGENGVLLTSRLLKQGDESPLFFTYFIKADQVRIGSALFSPGTLHQYRGENREMLFEKRGETLFLKPHMKGEMCVIPLAGGNHFWGADFLVAFTFDPFGNTCSWEIQ